MSAVVVTVEVSEMVATGPWTTRPAPDWGTTKLTSQPPRRRETRSDGHEVAPDPDRTPTLGGTLATVAPTSSTVLRSRSDPKYQFRLVAVPGRSGRRLFSSHTGGAAGGPVFASTSWTSDLGSTKRVESRSGTKTPSANAQGSMEAKVWVPVASS